MRAWIAIALATACSGTAKQAPAPPKPLTAKEIVQQATPAIVRVEVGDGDLQQTGTGFIVDQSGLVATNLHVVSGNKTIRVKLHGGETYAVTEIVGIDPLRDLAMLRIKPTQTLPTVRLGDSDKMTAGDQVIAIGNPLALDYTVSSGLVSRLHSICTEDMVAQARQNQGRLAELAAKPALSETEQAELFTLRCSLGEFTLLQISAPISQGSSGGPLFNDTGEVVGVTTLIAGAGQNINFAVPAKYLKPIVAQPQPISVEEFARQTAPKRGDDDGPRIVRMIPDHPLSVFDGCKREQIEEVVKAIWAAINIGAPLYNEGNHEACYRIYEGTATKYMQSAPCKGIQQAFTDGLSRAGTMDSFKLKAWAMRDTFDGLTGAAKRWAAANP
jgi:serine protease Do